MSEFKVVPIIEMFKKHRSFERKDDVLELLMKLHGSVEFNSTVDWMKLYRELGELYGDPRPYYIHDGFTPDPIIRNDMSVNDVFVFASNTEGRHGGGAAKEALDHYGAVYGQARGLQGRSYAIVTKDISKRLPNNNARSIELANIEAEIVKMLEFAYENQDLRFWMTKIGTGLAGFEIADIAPLFCNKVIPANVVLPEEFVDPRSYATCFFSPSRNSYYNIKDGCKLITVNNAERNYGVTERVFSESQVSLPDDVVVCSFDDYMTAAKYVMDKIY